MQSLKFRTQIEQEVKEALKAGAQIRLSTLRLLLSALKYEEIAKQKDLSEEEESVVVQRQVKQRKEAIEAYNKAGRNDLAQKEEAELQILSSFLPQQLSEEEIRKITEESLKILPESEQNFGLVMRQVMARVKGKADGNTVSKIVGDLFIK